MIPAHEGLAITVATLSRRLLNSADSSTEAFPQFRHLGGTARL